MGKLFGKAPRITASADVPEWFREALQKPASLDMEPSFPVEWNTLSSLIYLAMCSAYQAAPQDDYLRAVATVSTITGTPDFDVDENGRKSVLPWAETIGAVTGSRATQAVIRCSAEVFVLGPKFVENLLVPALKRLAKESGTVPDFNQLPLKTLATWLPIYKERTSGSPGAA